MSRAWFSFLVGLLPGADHARAEEMLEALSESEPTRRQIPRESFALGWAVGIAWLRYLRSAEGLWRSAYFGSVVWLATLIAVGPLLRFRFALEYGEIAPGSVASPATAVIAVAGAFAAVIAVRHTRWLATALAVVVVGAAAASSVIGSWSLGDGLWYEARWLGVAFVLMLALAARARLYGSLPCWGPLIACGLVVTTIAALPWPAWIANSSRNYALMLRWNILDSVLGYSAHGVLQWASIAAAIAVLVALFRHPFPAVVASPALLHSVIISPAHGLAAMALLAVMVSCRPIAVRLDIAVTWRRP